MLNKGWNTKNKDLKSEILNSEAVLLELKAIFHMGWIKTEPLAPNFWKTFIFEATGGC